MYYHFKTEKKISSIYAECFEIPQCTAEAQTYEELEIEMRKALKAIFINGEVRNIPLPELNIDLYKGFSVVTVPLDQELVFSLLLKHERHKNNFTQSHMAQAMGFKNIRSYQILEKNANPTLNTIYKVLKVLPDFPLNKLFKNTIISRSATKIKFSDV